MSLYRQFNEILDDDLRADAMRQFNEMRALYPDMDFDDVLDMRCDIIRAYDVPPPRHDPR